MAFAFGRFRMQKPLGNTLRNEVRAGKQSHRLLVAALLLVPFSPLRAQQIDPQCLTGSSRLGCLFAQNDSVSPSDGTPPAAQIQTIPGAQAPPGSTAPQTHGTPPPARGATGPAARRSGVVIGFLPPPLTHVRLDARQKWQIYVHQTFGPQNFVLPALQASYYMARPPRQIPREWEDGAGAFGRWYGASLAENTASRTGLFLSGMALHEDPRYLASSSANPFVRTLHAIGFTFVVKTDSGHDTFAFSNLAGAAAGGFVGMGFLPNRYGNVTHAQQRTLLILQAYAVRNIVTEFRPQWQPIWEKLRLPRVLPPWWWAERPNP